MKLRTGVFVVEDIAYLYKKAPPLEKSVVVITRHEERCFSMFIHRKMTPQCNIFPFGYRQPSFHSTIQAVFSDRLGNKVQYSMHDSIEHFFFIAGVKLRAWPCFIKNVQATTTLLHCRRLDAVQPFFT